jgi:hypothetical protein
MTPQTRRSTSDSDAAGYVPPISFQELHQAGRLSMPGAEAYEEGYGPLGDPTGTPQDPDDALEAFVAAWASAGHTPVEPLLP